MSWNLHPLLGERVERGVIRFVCQRSLFLDGNVPRGNSAVQFPSFLFQRSPPTGGMMGSVTKVRPPVTIHRRWTFAEQLNGDTHKASGVSQRRKERGILRVGTQPRFVFYQLFYEFVERRCFQIQLFRIRSESFLRLRRARRKIARPTGKQKFPKQLLLSRKMTDLRSEQLRA